MEPTGTKNDNNNNSSKNNDEREMYNDLKTFLLSDRPDLRIAATQAVVKTIQSDTSTSSSDSESNSSMAKLVRYGLILPLVQNISYDDSGSDDDDTQQNDKKKKISMDQVVALNALKALVYLSSHGTSANQCIQDLLDAKCISRLLEIVLPAKHINLDENNDTTFARARINYALALMANLTRNEQGAIELVGKTLPERAVPSTNKADIVDSSSASRRIKPGMEILTARFLNPAFVQHADYKQLAQKTEDDDDDENDTTSTNKGKSTAALDSSTADPYQHFAAVLMNVTQVEQGRSFLLQLHYNASSDKKSDDDNDKDEAQEGTSVFQKLLPQIKTSPNPIRRRGMAGLIRNVCLDKDSAWWLLNVVEVTRYILYPLAGPEELDLAEKQGLHPDLWLEGPDKEREPDAATRLFLVEAILLLCAAGRASRQRLRLDRVYVILKWADMVEEEEAVSERINECVQYLRRDEEGTEDGSSDQYVSDAYRQMMTQAAASPVVTTSAQGVATSSTSSGKQQQGKGEADFDDVD